MQVQIKKLPKSEVELTITVPYADYQAAEKKALAELNKEIKLDGFRSGHIPEDVVRKHVGKATLHSAALEILLPRTYTDAVKEHNLQVIATPKVDIKSSIEKEGDELVYVATTAVMPEVKMGNYKKIKIEKKQERVKKEQVEETIGMLLDRFASWKDVEREAKKGDRVEVDFEGFDEKDKAIPNTKSKNHPIVLGGNTMVPGFEDGIIGMSVGEEKKLTITFPRDYHAENLQNKKVRFHIKLGRLEEKEEQEISKDLIKKITGKEQSVSEFKKQVEQDLQAEMDMRSQQNHDNAVITAIMKITEVELPQALIDEEVRYMLDEKKTQVKRQGLTWEQYLQHVKKTEEDFAKDHQKAAAERLTARLGVQYIVKDAGISASDEETEAKIKELSARYPKEQMEKFLEYHKKDSESYRALKGNLAADKLIAMFTK